MKKNFILFFVLATPIIATPLSVPQVYTPFPPGIFGKYYLENLTLTNQTITTTYQRSGLGDCTLGSNFKVNSGAIVKISAQKIDLSGIVDLKAGSTVDLKAEGL